MNLRCELHPFLGSFLFPSYQLSMLPINVIFQRYVPLFFSSISITCSITLRRRYCLCFNLIMTTFLLTLITYVSSIQILPFFSYSFFLTSFNPFTYISNLLFFLSNVLCEWDLADLISSIYIYMYFLYEYCHPLPANTSSPLSWNNLSFKVSLVFLATHLEKVVYICCLHFIATFPSPVTSMSPSSPWIYASFPCFPPPSFECLVTTFAFLLKFPLFP